MSFVTVNWTCKYTSALHEHPCIPYQPNMTVAFQLGLNIAWIARQTDMLFRESLVPTPCTWL